MKRKLVVSLLVITTMLCPAFAFAAVEQDPMAVDETVVVAEDATTGDVVGEAVEVDELYAPETPKEIKAEAKEAIKEIKEEEKEALKEAKM